MMKKVLFTLSLASLCSGAVWAQHQPCATDEAHQKMVETNPEILKMEANLRKAIAEKIATNKMSAFARTTESDGSTVYHVPLVFHVIHDFGTEYVTDEAIRNCVKRINSMYNKQNADTIDVIPPFKGFIPNSNTRYIGNARIMWHLATIDPNGQPSTGITRRRTYLTNSGGNFAKYDQWPNENYMNIWLINTMSADNSRAAAYAYKPPTAELIPYYDGPIGMAQYIGEGSYTFSHELSHELNIDHVWGGTNDPEVACGDDGIDDTPITKGHAPPSGFDGCRADRIYDTACLYKRNVAVAKTRTDSFKRADGTLLLFSDNSTSKGITFKNRTTSWINSFEFYPTDTVGSTYKIGLSRNGVLIDSTIVVTTVQNKAQLVTAALRVPAADTSVNYKLHFFVNPGALRDTLVPSVVFSRGLNGSISMTNVQDGNFYNFFYNWKITYGNFQIYANDSLVDYPDTTNSQNVMDYTYCAKMFTAGQAEAMRAALTLTGPGSANRGNLITKANLEKTGIYDAAGNLRTAPEMAPKAEFLVDQGVNAANIKSTGRAYFLCATPESNYSFVFQNKTWRATPTAVNWTLSNGATVSTSTSTDKVTTKFANTGWATVTMVAENAKGADTVTEKVFVADPAVTDPIGYWQEFNDKAEIDAKWPMFNYYNNQYKWELSDRGYYDNTSIRYKSYDARTFPATLLGDPAGDYDDFYTPAFDLSKLGDNGNLNFMYAGAYATNDFSLMKDVMEIAYSTDCGGTWLNLAIMQNEELQTVGTVPMGIEYLSVSKDWKPKSIDLKSGATKIRNSRVFFRFRYKPSSRSVGGSAKYASGNNFYMDRIHISNNPLSVNEMILGERTASLAPNPTNSNAFVLFAKANANVHINVTDVTGKQVYSLTTKVDQNNAKVEIPASALLVKGFYMVHITGDDNLNQTEKLVVY
ncbi:MAG TPA: M43 family zinc metalloprotease [Chitinophagaceae bacterium]|nr:M43 family zinc metalloprotease [Chitinophagaceae bacterium]